MRSFMLRRCAFVTALVVCSSPLAGQTPAGNGAPPQRHTATPHALPSPTVAAGRRTSEITLDGRLDEPAWSAVQPATDLRPAQPQPEDPAARRADIPLICDAEALRDGPRVFA